MKLNVKEINSLPKAKRFEYLRENKKTLINIKKSSDIDGVVNSLPYKIITELKSNEKSNGKQFIAPEQDSIFVKVVANTANWIDLQQDLIIPGAPNKSISERKEFIPFLHDHLRTLDARIGDVRDIYEKEHTLRELGIDKEGSTHALIFEADVKRAYNKNIFEQYKNKQVNQHSIGLRYIDLSLAINDPEDIDNFKNWEQYIGQAINPERAIEFGYFWIVKEYKLIENSAVLFAACEISGTLETRSENIEAEQSPQIDEPQKDALDLNLLYNLL